mgnify:CR=1 FL=1
MKNRESDFNGFALACDPHGQIQQVLRNDLSEALELPKEGALSVIIDQSSVQKFFTFMHRLREEKALYDWSINVRGKNEIIELFFVGGMNGEEVVIVASTSQKVAASYFEEVLRVNNEQTNLIRSTMKEQAMRSAKPKTTQFSEYAANSATDGTETELFEDFTRLNNELANLQRDLHKKNQMLQETIEERNRYLGMATHDLRNPLSGIFSFSSLLLSGDFGELNNEQQQYIQIIKDSSEHMLELVSDVLDLSKYQSSTLQLNLEEVDMLELVNRSLAMNTPYAKKKCIEIKPEIEVESLLIKVDKLKITQVLDNLLSNAVKYSQQNTTITLRLYTKGAFVYLEVDDEGQGIPAKALPGIFEPFSRSSVETTAGESSTGLGLAITKRIVEGHGGKIEVDSEENQGSLFRVSIPLKI